MPSGIFTLRQLDQALAQGAWTNQKPTAVDYLVVAGGGGGGQGNNNGGGGGGAGGLLQGNLPVASGSSLTVTIGGGGSAGSAGSNAPNGSNSVFSSISAVGGGGGGGGAAGGSTAYASSGGSGGGGSGLGTLPGQGTAGQGNAGGYGQSISLYSAGGGGGAGTIGLSVPSGSGQGGNGGAGAASDISGSRTAYAGGGAGGGRDSSGTGGVGGGGNGGGSGGSGVTAGTANTGGGGGGGGGSYGGAAGGSGIVIISYPDTYAAAASTTGSPTVSTSGSGSFSCYDAGGSGGGSATTYVRFAGTSALAIGTTGTYEFWVYPTRYSTNHFVISQGVNSGVDIYYDTSGNVSAGNTSGGLAATVSGSPLSLNTWSHVAVTFNSGTVAIYINGVSKTLTGTTTGYNMTSTGTVSISGYQAILGQYGVIGYISNVRIVKGVVVYTGNFTPSTAPLQATQSAGTNIAAITGTQTSLLLNTVSGSFLADSSTNSYAPSSASTGTAAPAWNSASPFATGLGYKNRVYTWTSSGSITF